jgi:hypothetical protein
MISEDWIEILRVIPEEQHNTLVVTTLTGVDLNIEVVLRAEPTYLCFRGRVSGQTDDGRVFFLPYRQIDYLQINRIVKETEIRAMFGDAPDSLAGQSPSGVFAGASPSGVFAALSHHGLTTSPASPSAPASAIPTRPSLPGIAARLANGNGAGQAIAGRLSNGPSPRPANSPPNGYTNGTPPADGPTPPRNSILERLRAQRNSVVSTKPQGR